MLSLNYFQPSAGAINSNEYGCGSTTHHMHDRSLPH